MVHVHQFHPSVAYGDAVGDSIQELKNILTELGYESEIFAQYIHPKIQKVKKYSDYSKYSSPDNILILHYSIAYDQEVLNFFKSIPDKKILIYHNITPSNFFKGVNDTYEYYTKLGRDELSEFKNIISIALGDSRFNEDELRRTGFKNTDVLPIPINFKKFEIAGNSDIIRKFSDDSVNILTVARISPNKKIEDVIKTFYYYKKTINPKSRLFLVGSNEGMDTYYSQLRALIEKLQLKDVYFTGQVTFEELVSYYRISHIFITMSEHEGFCIPLLESMYFGIPIIAYNSTAIPHTMGNSGILINKKDPLKTAELINLLIDESTLREKVIQKQRLRLEIFDRKRIKDKIGSIISAVIKKEPNQDISYQIEGPFDSSYSLALVNREMAIALNKLYPDKIALYSTEGPGDYEPNLKFLSQHPDVDALWKMSKSGVRPYVVTRNLYPPRVSDMRGVINILNDYGWEESAFPPNYVNDFNRSLNGITVMSDFVKMVLVDNGISVPIKTIGLGVDHICKITPKQLEINLGTKFKFLHISSGFPRKGIDILLQAYARAFSKNDEVTLIIKTFPNMHNKVEEQIKKIRQTHPKCADIIVINEDLDYEYLIDLYHQSDVLVAPSRGEGFGLPVAEAMLLGLPVITTGFGGQCDFCNDENSWLIRYTFKRAETHMQLDDSIWTEPDVDHLEELMQTLINLPKAEIKKKTDKAQQNIQNNFKWIDCASRLDDFVKHLNEHPQVSNKKINLGWLTTWNAKCGVATYSSYILSNLDTSRFNLTIFSNIECALITRDEKNVVRCWRDASDKNITELLKQIYSHETEALVIQFNFGFINLYLLEELICCLNERNIKIFIMLHATEDINKPDFKASLNCISHALKMVDRIFVHSIVDLNRLKEMNIVKNVTLFPHGVLTFPSLITPSVQLPRNSVLLTSYGFLLPHKGILELIQAFSIVSKQFPNCYLLLINACYPNEESTQYKIKCRNLINGLKLKHKITLISDFLSDVESLSLLQLSDLIVFPYQNSQESASGAIRFGLASLKPVACTPIPIFSDVDNVVHFLPGNSPELLAKGITHLLENPIVRNSKEQTQKKWVKEHSWDDLTKRLENIIWTTTKLNNE